MLSRLKSLHLERSVFAPFMALSLNILLVYLAYSIARVEYLLENYSYFAQSVSEGHLPRLLWGGVVFDTPGIMYTNALYILLLMLPLHWKETAVYQRVCRWVFVVVNGLAIIVNLADSVYFRYTLRRTSTSVFAEFKGEDNIGSILGVELLPPWYLVVLGGLMVYGPWRLYSTPRIDRRQTNKIRYYLVMTVTFVFAAVLCVSGIRGGLLNHWYNYKIGRAHV